MAQIFISLIQSFFLLSLLCSLTVKPSIYPPLFSVFLPRSSIVSSAFVSFSFLLFPLFSFSPFLHYSCFLLSFVSSRLLYCCLLFFVVYCSLVSLYLIFFIFCCCYIFIKLTTIFIYPHSTNI